MSSRVVALLPMKGHSERVPNKNLRVFAGRPLYHAVMRTLLSSARIERVIVNTDSDDIAADIRAHFPDVQILERPEPLRGDFVSMNDVIGHDVATAPELHFLQTHSTNPLLTPETVDRSVEAYFRRLAEFDALAAVTRIQARLYFADGRPINHSGTGELLRTQDLPPVLRDASTIYVFSRDSFRAANQNRMGTRPQLFEIGQIEAIDIDEEADFVVAQACYRTLRPANDSGVS